MKLIHTKDRVMKKCGVSDEICSVSKNCEFVDSFA